MIADIKPRTAWDAKEKNKFCFASPTLAATSSAIFFYFYFLLTVYRHENTHIYLNIYLSYINILVPVKSVHFICTNIIFNIMAKPLYYVTFSIIKKNYSPCLPHSCMLYVVCYMLHVRRVDFHYRAFRINCNFACVSI